MSDRFKFKLNQTVILKLKDECLVTKIKFIGKTRIAIEHTRDFETGARHDGSEYIFLNEIKSVTYFSDPLEGPLNENSDQNTENNSESILQPKIKLTTRNFEKIERSLANIKFIEEVDETFYYIIEKILERNAVALLVNDSSFGRYSSFKCLTIATEDDIFIFDMRVLGVNQEDILRVLTSERPLKVVYNSSRVVDLLNVYDIKLYNFFDAYVSHAMLEETNDTLDLNDCIAYYLKLPVHFYPAIESSSDDDEHEIQDREKLAMGKQAIMLFNLYQYFVYDVMLDFYTELSSTNY